MAIGSLVMESSAFEQLLKNRLEQGESLLQRSISEDTTTIIHRRARSIIQTKDYDENEIRQFKSDFKKWDTFNAELLSRAFDECQSPQSYLREYVRIGNPDNLFGEDLAKEIKQQISDKVTYLESLIERIPIIPSNQPQENIREDVASKNSMTKDIFIVHGHDSGLKNEVARFVSDLGYNPIILHEQPNSRKTIIEKIESNSNVCYAIVLYTPCDIGASKDRTDFQPRARQNVVFEHGYLLCKVGRERVCALIKDEVEKPGDIDGIIYITYDSNNGWKNQIAKEFKNLGLTFNLDALLK